MAFTIITSTEIEVGDPVTSTTMTKVKDNFDDHEARLIAVEAVGAKVYVFNESHYNSSLFAGPVEGIYYWKAPAAFTLTEGSIAIRTKGSLTGTFEIDIQKGTSLDPSGYVSVFTTLPKIDYGVDPDYHQSTNEVFDNTEKNIAQGEWLRFDLTQIPSGGVIGFFHLILYGEV